MVSLVLLKVNSPVDALIDIYIVFSEGVILTCLLLFGSAGIEGLDWDHCPPIPEPDQDSGSDQD